MPIDVLMIAYAGFVALAMAMKRHRQAFVSSPRALRIGGATLLAFSWLRALYRVGLPQGPVVWLGSISLAALLLVLLMSWRPVAAFTLAVPGLALAGLLMLLD